MARSNSVLRNELKRPDGAILRWGAFGSGPVVVFVPGLGGDSLCWGIVPRLVAKTGKRVVLYDPRGMGASTLGDAPATMEILRDDLLALLELQGRSVTLFGWSMGAQLAVMAAFAGGPSRVSSLVLAAWTPDHRALMRQKPELFGPLCDDQLPLDSWCHHMAPLLGLTKAGEEAMSRQLSHCRDGLAFHQKALAGVSENIPDYDSLFCPVALFVGEVDELTPQREAMKVAFFVGWESYVLLDCHHGMIYQKPEYVADWLAPHIL